MAINVNTVYQTVLLILNKEQRGYMTPLEFNKTGAQAQLEIFENYFDSLNQQIRIPQTDTDYADRVSSLDEKISIFKEFGNATFSNNSFNLPSQFSGSGITNTTTNPAVTTAATVAYVLQNVTAAQVADSVISVFQDGSLLAETDYSITGTTVTFASQPVTLNLPITAILTPKEFYKLGTVQFQTGALFSQEVERVTRSALFHLLSSKLTQPSTTYPIYIYENNKLTIYPTSIQTGVSVAYIRKPLNPVWSFSVNAANNAYTFDEGGSQNFELHPAEQTELVLKILLYSGIVINDPTIIQAAAAQVQQEQNNQKS